MNELLDQISSFEEKILLWIEKEALVQVLIQAMARKGDPNEVIGVHTHIRCIYLPQKN